MISLKLIKSNIGKRLFSNKLYSKRLNNGQATNIKADLLNSSVNVRFETKWIDYTHYSYFDDCVPNTKTGHAILDDQKEIENNMSPVQILNDEESRTETIVWNSKESGEDKLIHAFIPEDISSFKMATNGDIKGESDQDTKFIANKMIDLNARNIDIRKARTNQFNAITKENFLIRSSLEANKLDIKSRVPTFGMIHTDEGYVKIGSLYGPSLNKIADILDNESDALAELKKNSINISSLSKNPVSIDTSHGLLNIEAPQSDINLKGIANTACYAEGNSIFAIFKDVENFAFLKAKSKINILIDESLIGIKIFLKQQGRQVGQEDIDIDGIIVLDIEDDNNLTIEYLSSFQILKRKIQSALYDKKNQ